MLTETPAQKMAVMQLNAANHKYEKTTEKKKTYGRKQRGGETRGREWGEKNVPRVGKRERLLASNVEIYVLSEKNHGVGRGATLSSERGD